MAPGGRLLIAIRYKYNVRKVLSCIVTDTSGNTQADLPNLYKYPYQLTYVAIRPVACLLLIYNLF